MVNMKLVTTKTGKIEGIEAEGYTIFKGIPYAKPPVGALRWKAPQPIEPWDGVYHADRFRERGWQEADTEGEVPFWKEKLVKELKEHARKLEKIEKSFEKYSENIQNTVE